MSEPIVVFHLLPEPEGLEGSEATLNVNVQFPDFVTEQTVNGRMNKGIVTTLWCIFVLCQNRTKEKSFATIQLTISWKMQWGFRDGTAATTTTLRTNLQE